MAHDVVGIKWCQIDSTNYLRNSVVISSALIVMLGALWEINKIRLDYLGASNASMAGTLPTEAYFLINLLVFAGAVYASYLAHDPNEVRARIARDENIKSRRLRGLLKRFNRTHRSVENCVSKRESNLVLCRRAVGLLVGAGEELIRIYRAANISARRDAGEPQFEPIRFLFQEQAAGQPGPITSVAAFAQLPSDSMAWWQWTTSKGLTSRLLASGWRTDEERICVGNQRCWRRR